MPKIADKSRKKPGFVSAGSILNKSLSQLGLAGQINLQRTQQSWPKVVGEKIAGFSSVVGLVEKRLKVNLTDPEWLSALAPLQQDIALKLNQILGEELIEEVIFETAASGKRSSRKLKPKT